MDYEDLADMRTFKLLSAMNANQTSDADGTDEFNVFKGAIYLDNQWSENLFYMNLTEKTDQFVKGWSENYAASETYEWDFTYDNDCYIKFTLEE